ncbi:MAG TPA: CoA transferase [Actinomycetales bacterium]|nr:CoA transferase [Actinomycetales bacterium]
MSTQRGAALRGVQVVCLATNLPGPVAAARLVALGASVVKVEPPTGDPLGLAVPDWYRELVAGQEVLTLDLKDAAGRATLETRLETADVLLTAMRPSAASRLGLGESVAHHGLVLVEIVGYDGDRAEEAGHDLTYQAAQGTIVPPVMPLVPVVDLLGAERAVTAVLVGLRRRDAGESAPHVRVVLDDAATGASAALRHGLTGPGGALGGALPGYGIYATADGHVAVAALEPHFAQRLAGAVGSTREELTARFASEPSAHWEALARSLDIPIVALRPPG